MPILLDYLEAHPAHAIVFGIVMSAWMTWDHFRARDVRPKDRPTDRR
jgi:hypothetical protein